MSSKLTAEDTKQDHKLQAILLCDTWGEELRWGPLVRPNRGEDDEEDAAQQASGSERRPWVRIFTITPIHRLRRC